MLRQAFADRLKEAMKARDPRTTSAVRMILAGLKERDVAARTQGNTEGLSDDQIRQMLQTMIKQRRESIALYEKGKRADLAGQEREEIAVIESFLPRQLDDAETEAIAKAAIAETGAANIRDVGKVMAALRKRYPGAIELGRAAGIVRRLLG
ncbi:MAG TPA: GatB/YqeY domain-containing protein [Stellaceae bacterium]|nr:GatB/YqeY domain-containing protein [Stellaceae bacterium]